MYKLEDLKAPFDPSLVKYRMGTVSADQQSAVALPYVDAHVVEARLNEVLGLENWDSRISINGVVVTCRLSVKMNGEWVGKEDGTAIADSTPDRREIAVKAAISDAFKRAAAQWGVGRYFYAEPARIVPVKAGASGRLELVLTDLESSSANKAPDAVETAPNKAVAPQAEDPKPQPTVTEASETTPQTGTSEPLAETSTAAIPAAANTASNEETPAESAAAIAFEVKGSKGMVKVPANLPAADHERIRSLIPRLTTGCDNAVAVENYRRYLDDPNGRVKPFMSAESVAFLHQVLDQHVALAQKGTEATAA